MDWLYYLLEANLYLLLFYGFYRLLLANTTFYSSNRYFLLICSITAFLLPIMQLGYLNPTPIIDNVLFLPPILYTEMELANIASTPIQANTDYATYLYPIYLFIAFCFAVKLGLSISKIILLWLKAEKLNSGKITLIELNEEKSAFSFFNLLFIHPHLAEKEAVLKHEMVHIKQIHSLDILFFEIVQIVCWFNPIIYFMKKDIKLLHEYIADELSTNSNMQKHEYAMFLIENSFGIVPQSLTNQIFNQSILKRRINMLNKKRTAGWARLRLLLTLPLVGVMLCASTMAFTKDYGYVDLLPEKSKIEKATVVVLHQEKKTFSPKFNYDKDNHYISLENRLIVINGEKVTDNDKYYGSADADKIIYLNSTESIKKYGNKIGKFGAVEITGKNAVSTYPPPIVKQDQVKFPPPIGTLAKTFFPSYQTGKNKQYISLEKRVIFVNGVEITDKNKFYGVTNADTIRNLNPVEAIAKYGSVKGKLGAVEITGKTVKRITVKPDNIKFPPPIVKSSGKSVFLATYEPDYKTGIPKLTEKRYIVINGNPIPEINKFYGVSKISSLKFLKPSDAVKKYGDKASYGAVEVNGNNLEYFKFVTLVPEQDRIKFPPPAGQFVPIRSVNPDGKINYIDQRFIVINGKKINNINTFFGVTNATKIVSLNGKMAIKKYGSVAKYGAVEITGKNLKYVKSISDGPAPPIMTQVKFPPPIPKHDATN